MDGKRDVGALMDRNWEVFPPRNIGERIMKLFRAVFADPMVKLKLYLDSKREPYYWYHRKYNRVPTIDQCYEHDSICQYEADIQIKRDRMLDQQIVILLRGRFHDCMLYERYEREKCRDLLPALEEAENNFFIKYGEVGCGYTARRIFMKQKHRLAWERRHGEVGTGMREKHYRNDGTVYWK